MERSRLTTLASVFMAVAAAVAASPGPAVTESDGLRLARADTVLAARRGDRLVVENLIGRISVRAGSAVEVRAEMRRSDEGDIELRRSGDRLVLRDRDRKGRRLDRRVELTVPEWLDVDIRGPSLDVSVEGLRASVTVWSAEGDLTVRNVEGTVRLTAVEGEILLEDVRGDVHATGVDDSVHLLRVSGSLEATSTNGDVTLEDVEATMAEATTLNGDILFDGVLVGPGPYRFVTHDGDLEVAIPADADARVAVSTFAGDFEPGFPLRLQRVQGGKELTFDLGSGGPRLILQAFDGDIRLRHRR